MEITRLFVLSEPNRKVLEVRERGRFLVTLLRDNETNKCVYLTRPRVLKLRFQIQSFIEFFRIRNCVLEITSRRTPHTVKLNLSELIKLNRIIPLVVRRIYELRTRNQTSRRG